MSGPATNQRDLVTGLLYVVFGAVVAIGSLQYQTGSLARLGPGFFPLVAGTAVAAIGAGLAGLALRRGAARESRGRWSGKNFLIVLASIVLFGALLEPMGLVTAAPMLVGVSSLARPGFSWWTVLRSMAVLLLLTWVIFIALLGLPIPLLPPFVVR